MSRGCNGRRHQQGQDQLYGRAGCLLMCTGTTCRWPTSPCCAAAACSAGTWVGLAWATCTSTWRRSCSCACALAGIFLCVLCLLYGGFWRIQMQRRLGLPASNHACCCRNKLKPDVSDCLQWLCRYSCALAQEVRTADALLEDDGVLLASSSSSWSPSPPAAAAGSLVPPVVTVPPPLLSVVVVVVVRS
ncbi:uncharacterized protein C2845_PM04G34530 [Panicum miliaceum]|uniref:Uncharacterized protein n=1 Tax=Panicum miliaceum TaxID=4540 RepID=A0A3L6QN73_PANMI|nr:uncharacterized protein C2845_PM04G34530 [Panicum miliaceum]